MKLINVEEFTEKKRRLYCDNCERRMGMKNEKKQAIYEIGDAPCKSCWVDDMLGELEDWEDTGVHPVVKGRWIPSEKHKGYDVCSACHNCYVPSDWTDGQKWKFCPECGSDNREDNHG